MANFCQEALAVGFHAGFEKLCVIRRLALTLRCTRKDPKLIRSEGKAVIGKMQTPLAALLASEESSSSKVRTAPRKADKQ